MNELFFQALSSPVRREILSLLKFQSLSAGEIAKNFSIAQPSVSRHLEVLREATLVTTRRQGNQIIYSLNLSATQELLMALTDLLSTQKEAAHDRP